VCAGKAAEDQAWTLEQVRKIAGDWRDFLHLAPAGAKPYLRRLLGDNPVVVTKTATGWSYEFRGILNPVLKGLIDYVEVPVEAPAQAPAGAGEVHNERADRVRGTR
jgi:hypothetical protein